MKDVKLEAEIETKWKVVEGSYRLFGTCYLCGEEKPIRELKYRALKSTLNAKNEVFSGKFVHVCKECSGIVT